MFICIKVQPEMRHESRKSRSAKRPGLGPKAQPCRQRPGHSWSPAACPASNCFCYASQECNVALRAGPFEAALTSGFRSGHIETLRRIKKAVYGNRQRAAIGPVLAEELELGSSSPGLCILQGSTECHRVSASPKMAKA